jgi:hypothetical protein
MSLPKYRQLKIKTAKLLLDVFENIANEELGPFASSKRFIQHEGQTMVHNTMDNNEKQSELKYVEAKTEYKLKYVDIPKMNADDVLKLISDQAKEFGGQQARHHYSVINKATEETGNVVRDNKGLTAETFFAVIEKIQIPFDEEGNPEMPTMVIDPRNTEAARKLIQDSENNPEHKKRMEKLLAKKKKEYDAEQASRKLVD